MISTRGYSGSVSPLPSFSYHPYSRPLVSEHRVLSLKPPFAVCLPRGVREFCEKTDFQIQRFSLETIMPCPTITTPNDTSKWKIRCLPPHQWFPVLPDCQPRLQPHHQLDPPTDCLIVRPASCFIVSYLDRLIAKIPTTALWIPPTHLVPLRESRLLPQCRYSYYVSLQESSSS